MHEVQRLEARRFGALLVLLCTVVFNPVPGARAQSVEVTGLRIVGPGMGRNGSEIRAFDTGPGLTVALGFDVPSGVQLVEIDSSGCELESLTQDDGTSLLEDVDWGFFPDVSEDGRAGMIEFSNARRPGAGTKSLRARGKLALRVAGEAQSGTVKGFAAKEGTEFQAAGDTFLVQKAGEDEEYGGYSLVLETKAETADRISELHFKTADGEEIDINGQSTMTMGSRTQLEFYIENSTRPAVLDLVWFDELESLEVPFDVEFGLALGIK
ncbi:MAG: hypothetical protein AAF690_26160 [Acidobacteriota bacterium]